MGSHFTAMSRFSTPICSAPSDYEAELPSGIRAFTPRSPSSPRLQAALHWDVAESTQLVAPMGVGLLLFDLVYMVALLLKLRML